MFLEYNDDGHFEVATGTLSQSDGIVQFMGHMYVADTHDGGASIWIPSISGRLAERWLVEPYNSEEAKSGWTKPDAERVSAAAVGKLHAHCHCGGVEFFISRPNAESLKAQSPYPDLMVPYHSGPPDNPDNEPWWLRSNQSRYLAGTCACTSCRKAAGFDIVEWAFVPTANISLSGGEPFRRDFGTLRAYSSSKGVTRRFCGRCGACVFWDGDERPTLTDVAVGLLDAPSGARAEEWLDWWTERVSFREDALSKDLIDGLERGIRSWGQTRAGTN